MRRRMRRRKNGRGRRKEEEGGQGIALPSTFNIHKKRIMNGTGTDHIAYYSNRS